ncbi:LacI family DNA-binding transcriptional regulator [Persicobacter psychrovividus]|uniref:LacI family transcriptional regulator n=1 Tax=Persicobacter psychrovividus TaxID=387638 RepID=A0ABM7VIH3_9BACT|nr:LacI family transcriptional regulator [Persicobacter psychrovividus]
MAKQTTIHDIAKALGINSSTVSRALNDHPRVSIKTKQKVFEMAKEMNYQPNVLAANLRTKRSNTLGIVVPHISRAFFSNVIAGVEEYAQQKGFNVIIAQSKDMLERERKSVQTLMNSRVDGILISPALGNEDAQHIQEVIDRKTPVFFFDRHYKNIETTRVLMDDQQISAALASNIIQQGAKRFLVLSGDLKTSIYQNRLQGINNMLADYELPEAMVQETNLTYESSSALIEQIVQEGSFEFDAVMAMNDMAALGAQEALKKAGFTIPDQVLISGFSNEMFSRFSSPPITTVDQNGDKLGYMAAKKIIDFIEDPDPIAVEETSTLKSELILRKSSQRYQ